MTASGVRSSWDALAANRCCSATCASSRARRPSMVSPRSLSSSRGPERASRSSRLCSEILPRRRGHRPQGPQDPARDQPAERDREHRHDRQRDPGPDEQLVEIVCVEVEGPVVLLFGDMPDITGDVGFRQRFLDGTWAARPGPTPSPRDDQVRAARAPNEEVRNREQHRPRQEKQAAVEQGQAQADGPRGQAEHPTGGEPGERVQTRDGVGDPVSHGGHPVALRFDTRLRARWR